jgi:hypothetical protein
LGHLLLALITNFFTHLLHKWCPQDINDSIFILSSNLPQTGHKTDRERALKASAVDELIGILFINF